MDTQPKRRGPLRLMIIAVVVLVVLVIGGPLVYINLIEGKSPAKLSFTDAGDSGSGASVPLDGTWSVDFGSQVGYRVGEQLFGQTNTAVGRTTDVSGAIVIGGSEVKSGTFTANLTTVKSDQSQRDSQFQRRIMETAKYPDATFTLTKPLDFGTPPPDGVTKTVTATGKLTLHGTIKAVTFPMTARHMGATIEVLGSIPVVFADYKISNPSFGGVVTTESQGTLEFLISFTKGTAPSTVSPGESASTTTTVLGGQRPSGSGAQGGPPKVSPTTVAPLGF